VGVGLQDPNILGYYGNSEQSVMCKSLTDTKQYIQSIWQDNAEGASLCLGLVEMVIVLQVTEMEVQTVAKLELTNSRKLLLWSEYMKYKENQNKVNYFVLILFMLSTPVGTN
jgi:hypothetical protein